MKDYTNSLKDLDINSDKNTTEILKLRNKYSIEENPDSPLSKIKELKKYVDEQEEKHLEKIKDYVQNPDKYNRTEFLLYQENYKIYMNSVKNELNESIENYKTENKIKFKS